MAKKAQAGPIRPQPTLPRRPKQRSVVSFAALIKVTALPLGVAATAVLAWFALRWWKVPTTYHQVHRVQRLNASEPHAMERFFQNFHGRLPVVIDGALSSWPAMQWTPALLTAKCPAARLPVYTYDLAATDWAALRDSGEMPLHQYLAEEFGHGSDVRDGARYGLEMSLRNECPVLLEDVRIPAFFTDDLLVRYYKKAAWPTLIVGPRGSRSGLHRDTHDLPFWMALFSGRKHWRIFAANDEAMEAHYRPERNGFSFDPFRPDFWKHPDLALATPYDHVLEAGQLLYIPNGAPHGAYNLDDTIAISGNYLDTRSLGRHYNTTCSQPLWQDSKLCWAYEHDFARHKPPEADDLKELNFFQFSGFSGSVEWCRAFLPDLRERGEKRAELKRCLPIVESYCSMPGE